MDLYIYEISENVKVAYLSVAKCASNDIRNVFKKIVGEPTRLNVNIHDKTDKRLEGLTIFSFVRNPWERFHSAFNMMHGKTSLQLPGKFLNFTQNPDACRMIDPGHWTPQYDQLITETGELLPTFIGNINNLHQDIETLLTQVVKDENIKTQLISKLQNIKSDEKQHVKHKDFTNNAYYIKYYNLITFENVEKYLKTDIELFNFTFQKGEANLDALSIFYGLDKNILISHNYIPAYEDFFHVVKKDVKTLLEIGVGGVYDLNSTLNKGDVKRNYYKSGNSLRMWRDYFINANVYGIDINSKLMFKENRLETFVASQDNEHDLKTAMGKIGCELDVVIDDGSHLGPHQVFSFMTLYPYLSKNGIYIIEDVQAQDIQGFQNLSIFPEYFITYINQHFNVQYIDTRQSTGKKDDFMVCFTQKIRNS